MKLATILIATLLSTVVLAQESVTVTTAPGNTAQTFYSFQNGVQGSALLADWDLAFEITGFTASILVNTAKGLTVFETPAAVADWSAVSAPDEASWTPIYNAETDWSEGALTHGNNLGEPDGFDVGWGTYSMVTHTIAGTRVYVVKSMDETYRKLRINSLMSGTYSFTYADLDGDNEQTTTLAKSNFTGKNFGYFSFSTGVTSDPEPATATWDLLFTKYTAIIPMPAPTPYGVSGVLLNKNVSALQVDGVDQAVADWNNAPFDTALNIIGYDWKVYDQVNNVYTYPADRTYFVEDLVGNIWKLIFTAYGGGSTGDMTFTQELVSATGIEESDPNADLVLYPNPAQGGRTQLVLERSVVNAGLSVMDMGGKLVLQQRVTGTGGLSLVPLDLSGLDKGLYLVRLDAANGTSSARVIVD